MATPALISTVLLLKQCPFLPDGLKLKSHVPHLRDSSDHIMNLKVSSGLWAEVLWLRSVVGLPPLTEGVIHPILREVIILEIEVVEIVHTGLDLFPIHDYSDKLGVGLLVGDLDVDRGLGLSLLLAGQLVIDVQDT